MNENRTREMFLESELQLEIESMNNFSLMYQPKISLHQGHIMGAEALLRWHHPKLGYIPPSEFIPIAERCGLIHHLGNWALKKACRQLKLWHSNISKELQVSVNLSLLQLEQNDIINDITSIIEESRIEPNSLELEITESITMDGKENLISKMNYLRKYGVNLALDDFGTGYSSLNYLSKLPIHTLKIDKSFIKELKIGSTNWKIVEAIVNVAHGLHMKVVVEGVELEEHVKILRELDCDILQGYYFKSPCTPLEFEKYYSDFYLSDEKSSALALKEQALNTFSKVTMDVKRKFKILKTYSKNLYFGDIQLIRDIDNEEDILCHSFSNEIANFIGINQIKLNCTRMYGHSNSILKLKEFITTESHFMITYHYEKGQVPLFEYIKGMTYKGKLELMLEISKSLFELHIDIKWHGCLIPEYIWVCENGKVVFQNSITSTPFTLISPYEISFEGFPYFAPELFRMRQIDSRTDLYNLGVLFYYILTERFPVSKDKLIFPPSALNEDIPLVLDRIVLKMFHKKQSERYQWVEEVLEALSLFQENKAFSLQSSNIKYGSQFLFSSEFTGREKEVEAVSRYYSNLISGEDNNSNLLLIGETGTGRRQIIIESAANYHKEIGYISGTAKEIPLSSLEEITRKILISCFSSAKKLKLGQKYLHSISRIFPDVSYMFKDHFVHQKIRVLEEQNPKMVLVNLFIDFLDATDLTMVFEIYDAHLLDLDSIEILRTVMILTKSKFGVIGVSNFEYPNSNLLFKKKLEVNPLTFNDYKYLISSIFGKTVFINDDFYNWINFHSSGLLNKTFYLISYLADSQQIYLKDNHWRMVGTISDLELPNSIQSVVTLKLKTLPSRYMKVLQIISLFDFNIKKDDPILETVVRLANLKSKQELLIILQRFVELGIMIELMTHFQFNNSEIRLNVYISLSEDEKEKLHIKMADALLSSKVLDFELIGHQYEMGKRFESAIYLYLVDARRCIQNHLFEKAIKLINRSLSLYRISNRKKSPIIIEKYLGMVLWKSGDFEESSKLHYRLYNEIKSPKILNLFAFSSINCGQFKQVEPFLKTMQLSVKNDFIEMRVRTDCLIALGYYYLHIGNHNYLTELELFHNRFHKKLRTQLNVKNYIRWIYNLYAILSQISEEKKEEYSHILYEALYLAEQYNMYNFLVPIYNVLGFMLSSKDLNKAKEYFYQSSQLSQKQNFKNHELTAKVNLIGCYTYLGDVFNAKKYIKKARNLEEVITTNSHSIELLLQEAHHYLYIEEFEKVLEIAEKIKNSAKETGQNKYRSYVFILKYKVFLELRNMQRLTKMFPILKSICEKYHFEDELFILKIKHDFLVENYEFALQSLPNFLERKDISKKMEIMGNLLLAEANINLKLLDQVLEKLNYTKELMINSSYNLFMGDYYLLKSTYYRKTNNITKSKIYMLRAHKWFIKLHQSKKVKETSTILSSEVMENKNNKSILEEIKEKLLLVKPYDKDSSLLLKQSIYDLNSLTYSSEEKNNLDALEEQDLLLDNVQRINSTFDFMTLIQRLASVLFENILFDTFYITILSPIGVLETKCFNEYSEIIHYDCQHKDFIKQIIDNKNGLDILTDCSYGYGTPIISNEEVLGSILLESNKFPIKFTVEEKQWINKLMKYISTNIQNSIMYQSIIIDDLTGLHKRNYFLKRINEEYKKASKHGNDLAVIMIDLDNFSDINNEYGHQEGDRVLISVAKTLQKMVRYTDIIGRYGGEEFIIILPNTSGLAAKKIGGKLLNQFLQISEELNHKISASIGISSLDLDHPENEEDLIKKADEAELFAKKNGKNQVICYWEMRNPLFY
ncbi:EAL domain-containing protein [Bacillus sp. CGMCC 1.16607]|uniref:EAL domain-containing protein n=1 Tax=Bacillus sp. CGMCC 1.16607 TaxID=3351842 RepID=UPI00362C8970